LSGFALCGSERKQRLSVCMRKKKMDKSYLQKVRSGRSQLKRKRKCIMSGLTKFTTKNFKFKQKLKISINGQEIFPPDGWETLCYGESFCTSA